MAKKIKVFEANSIAVHACAHHGTAVIELADANGNIHARAHLPAAHIEEILITIKEATAEGAAAKRAALTKPSLVTIN